ncbi:MAG: EamA family transporter [Actinomycetia bacterium]|nr:EamA family transporter [Actinomycetes bacterium]
MVPARRLSAVWYVLGSIVTVQVGAAFAKGIFGQVSPTAMTWLRLVFSAAVLLPLARPRLRGRSWADWLVLLGYSCCLVAMNWAIYQAFHRIPLGLAVTIEFLGPLTVAAVTSRSRRDVGFALLAGVGVAVLGFTPTVLDLTGVGLAGLASVAWAGYIVASPSLAVRWRSAEGVALASLYGAVVLAAPAVVTGGPGLLDLRVLGTAALVAILSSVIPFTLELAALRILPRRVFAVLMSLEPAAAAVAALLVLGERLSLADLVAMTCVVAASVGITRAAGQRTA